MSSATFHKPTRIGLTTAEESAVHIAAPDDTPLGDSRPDPAVGQPDLLTKIASLPEAIYDMTHDSREMRNVLAEALQRQLYLNSADAGNLAGTATTVGANAVQVGSNAAAWVPCFVNYTQGVGARLRNILVGASAAGVVQIVRSKADWRNATYFPDQAKLLCTVRLTTTTLSVPVLGEFLLAPGDNLYAVYLSGNTINLDFSCDYRQMRGE